MGTIRSFVRLVRGLLEGGALWILRRAGLLCPRRILPVLLAPPALLQALLESALGRPSLAAFRRLSGSVLFERRRPNLGRLLLGRTRMNMTKFRFLWPERIAPSRDAECRVRGAEGIAELRSGRPVILLTLHFGVPFLGFSWLRLEGCPVVSIVMRGRPRHCWYRRRLDRLRDRIGGLAGVPQKLEAGEAWAMQEHLEKGGVLMATIDGRSRRRCLQAAQEGLLLSMRTGLLQLAAFTNASVVPCLFRADPRCGMTFQFGSPIPGKDLEDKTEQAEACAGLFDSFLPVLRSAPEQCSAELLLCLQRRAPRTAQPVAVAGSQESI